jgi:hypothetical protein
VAEGAVTVAYCHGNEVAHSWHESLTNLIGYDLANHQRVIAGGWLAMKCGTGGLVEGRNEAVASFLRERDAEWLLWLDTDMGFAPDMVDRLVDAADPAARPIVGALCFAQRETAADGMGGYRTEPRPTLFDWATGPDGNGGFIGRTTWPVASLVQVAGTGSACILIHRTALQAIGEKFGTWYDRLPKPDGGHFGEDLSFCIRAGAVAAPIFVHTGVRASHLKFEWLQEADYWATATAPPASQRTAVVVPVMRRPESAAPFMASLRASTGLADVFAIADEADTDTVRAWEAAGAVVLHATTGDEAPGTFAQKVNHGARYLTVHDFAHPWLFMTGDDVRFHPGWLDHAQAIAGDRFDVVGTNDLGNPRVTSGEHATHLLIRRTYVAETGASWDGPGSVAHAGYRHWFVDNEIVTAAKQRGVWAMALGSRVEHLHPRWGKGEQDEVYRLGAEHADADADLFRARLKEFGGGAA